MILHVECLSSLRFKWKAFYHKQLEKFINTESEISLKFLKISGYSLLLQIHSSTGHQCIYIAARTGTLSPLLHMFRDKLPFIKFIGLRSC